MNILHRVLQKTQKSFSVVLLGLILLLSFAENSKSFAENPPITVGIGGNNLILTPTLPPNTGTIWRVKQGQNGIWYISLVTANNNVPALYDYIITIIGNDQPNPQPPPPPPPPPPNVLVISTENLPNGTVGVVYKQTVAVTGGSPPYSLSVASAYLPKGLTINGLEIGGTPNEVGTYNFVLQAKDGKGLVSTKSFTVNVVGSPPPPPPPPPVPGPLFALIVYDPDKLDNMPVSQAGIFSSQPIRNYLDSKCAKNTEGKPQWKFLSWNSKDDDVKKLGNNFLDWYKETAAKAKSENKAYLTITNGKDKFSGVLPENTSAVLELLKKYGG